MRKVPNYRSAKEYFESLSDETQKKLNELKEIIVETFPHCEELLNYDIPAYALVRNGKRDKQVMIAGYKSFVSLYVGNNILGRFKNELKSYTVGKASIQFPIEKALPKKLITRIIKYKMKMI